ncbi:MAG TPA: HAMP domain-containing sensor histidine kinase [Propionibacteriaceae bacterium]
MADILSTGKEAAATQPTPLGRGTLGRRLVISVAALVAIAAILLSALTTLATRQLLLQEVDQQLSSVANRSRQSDPRGQRGPQSQLLQRGQPIGTIAAVFPDDGSNEDGRILPEGADIVPPQLPDDVMDQLRSIPLSKGSSQTESESVQLVDLGHYRIAVYPATITFRDGTTASGRAVVGIPLDKMDHTLVELVGLELVLTLLAMAGAAFGARAVVVRSLRPLNRVAATAQQVSQLPLDRGEVALAVRVPPEDADPTSEVGRVGQALNHMLNNVEDALAARQASEVKVRQFVADASHELRNPLAAIRGYAELTRRSREELPPDAAYAISRVESEAARMSHLVEDLLLLARLDSGPDLDVQPTDLSEIVINAVSDARVAGPDHAWQLSLPSEPVVALGDPHRLHQVVANLLANARTHTPAGSQVRSGIAVVAGEAVITVTDDGPGIPVEIQNQVFERFTRADTSRVRAAGAAEQGKSTGLGLAIVTAVVEAHQGRVTVRSQPGHTEFTVFLPLAPQSDHVGPGPDMVAPHSS